MLRAWVLICFLLLYLYCAVLRRAVVLLPLVYFAARARVAGHELFVAVVRFGWPLVCWKFRECAKEWEEEFVAVTERVREDESWDQYDEVFDSLPVARPVVHA